MSKETYVCQECNRLVLAREYHPYWHCVLHKARQLDVALKDIKNNKAVNHYKNVIKDEVTLS